MIERLERRVDKGHLTRSNGAPSSKGEPKIGRNPTRREGCSRAHVARAYARATPIVLGRSVLVRNVARSGIRWLRAVRLMGGGCRLIDRDRIVMLALVHQSRAVASASEEENEHGQRRSQQPFEWNSDPPHTPCTVMAGDAAVQGASPAAGDACATG